MAVTVREHLAASSLAAPITINLGAGTAIADVVVALHFTAFYPAADMQAPTGGGTWQGPIVIARNDATNAPHIKAWWLPVTTGGAQAIDFNHAQLDPPHNVVVAVLIGADTVNPVSDSDVLNDAFGTAQVAPSVDGEAGGMLLCGWVSDDLVTYTAPGSMTGLQSDNTFNTAMGAYEALPGAGATGTRTATSSAAKTHTAVSVAIRAGGGAEPGPVAGMRSTLAFPGAGPFAASRFRTETRSADIPVQAADVDVDGALDVSAALAGETTVDTNVAGDASAAFAATGTLGFTVDVQGTRDTTAALAGAVAVDTAVAGSVGATAGLTGAIAVESPVEGARAVSVALAGAAAVETATDGTMAAAVTLAGTIDIQGRVDVDGTRSVSAAAAGTLAVSAGVAGQRAVDVALAGTVDVLAPVRLDGNRALAMDAVGALAVTLNSAGNRAVAATITGAVDITAPFTPAPHPVEGYTVTSAGIEAVTATGIVDGSTVSGAGVE